MKLLLPFLCLLVPMLLFAQDNQKIERLNSLLSKSEVSEGKCGQVKQQFFVKNGKLIYTQKSKKCNKLDSLWMTPGQINVESNYVESGVSTITISCKNQGQCIDKIAFLGNRSLVQPTKEQQLKIETTLAKREFNNMVYTLSQL